MNDRKRTVALLCAFVLVFSTALSGCAKKVKFEEQTTTKDNKIKINTIDMEIPDGSSIVVGDDGQSYLVDGEGNSVVYEAPSAYVIPDVGGNTTTTTTKTTKKTTTKKTTTTTTTTTQPTTSQQSKVYDVLSRKRPYNIVEYMTDDLPNYNVNSIEIGFEDGPRSWLIKFYKGQYDSSTIGCESCIYTKPSGNSSYKKADDEFVMNVNMTMWQMSGGDCIKTTNGISKNSWWVYNFEQGKLEGKNPKNLALKCDITLKSGKTLELFVEALENNGFTEGSSAEKYQDAGKYIVNGQTVTFVWR